MLYFYAHRSPSWKCIDKSQWGAHKYFFYILCVYIKDNKKAICEAVWSQVVAYDISHPTVNCVCALLIWMSLKLWIQGDSDNKYDSNSPHINMFSNTISFPDFQLMAFFIYLLSLTTYSICENNSMLKGIQVCRFHSTPLTLNWALFSDATYWFKERAGKPES